MLVKIRSMLLMAKVYALIILVNPLFIPPKCDFSFNNVLHVPFATKNLASVHKFTKDNDVFIEFHPTFFCVKDLNMKTPLLHGRCQDGPYPMPQSSSKVHHVVKPTTSLWHHNLGHHSSIIVNRVLRDNNLSFSSESSPLVCDACQQAKSYQLPYPQSDSTSYSPLELIFSDVWDPAPKSVGHYQYYVSLLMILLSLHGYICSRIALKCFKFFVIFSNMLSASLIKNSCCSILLGWKISKA